jgi:hypothetical protein
VLLYQTIVLKFKVFNFYTLLYQINSGLGFRCYFTKRTLVLLTLLEPIFVTVLTLISVTLRTLVLLTLLTLDLVTFISTHLTYSGFINFTVSTARRTTSPGV